jgi:aspartyl-tRNA(Asn)/glutamyl-tRNA(Gln) amidotransferase subunit B
VRNDHQGALRAVAAGDERGWRDVVDALFPPVGDGEGGGEGGGDAAVEAMCRDIVCGMPEEVALFKAGKTRLMGKFVGEAMRRTNGRADPKVVSRALTRALSEEV